MPTKKRNYETQEFEGGIPITSELLTPGGWVPLRDLPRSARVWAVDPRTGFGRFERQNRKIKVKKVSDILVFSSELRSGGGGIGVASGHRVPLSSTKRPVIKTAENVKPGRLKIYTTSMGLSATPLTPGLIDVIFAALRYGIIDRTGCSVRIYNAEHRDEFARLVKRRGMVRDGWEKWMGAVFSPMLRGSTLDLSGLGCNHAEAVYRSYLYWLHEGSTPVYVIDTIHGYLSRSGMPCSVVDGRIVPSEDKLPIKSTWISAGEVVVGKVGIQGAYVLVRVGGRCAVVGA